MVTDTKTNNLRIVLHQIYVSLYVEYGELWTDCSCIREADFMQWLKTLCRRLSTEEAQGLTASCSSLELINSWYDLDIIPKIV